MQDSYNTLERKKPPRYLENTQICGLWDKIFQVFPHLVIELLKGVLNFSLMPKCYYKAKGCKNIREIFFKLSIERPKQTVWYCFSISNVNYVKLILCISVFILDFELFIVKSKENASVWIIVTFGWLNCKISWVQISSNQFKLLVKINVGI